MISKEDILFVAGTVGMKLTKEQIQEVLNMYEAEVYGTEGSSWELIVENILYKVLEKELDFLDLLKKEKDRDKRTELLHNYLKTLNDDLKMKYAINWVIPHRLFTITCRLIGSDNLQNIDWYKIFKSKDIGYWSNGNKVLV